MSVLKLEWIRQAVNIDFCQPFFFFFFFRLSGKLLNFFFFCFSSSHHLLFPPYFPFISPVLSLRRLLLVKALFSLSSIELYFAKYYSSTDNLWASYTEGCGLILQSISVGSFVGFRL